MKRKFLDELGLDKDTVDRIMEENGRDIENAKGELTSLTAERDRYRNDLADRDRQLEDLRKSSGDNAQLQQQIKDLQKANSDQQTQHAEEIAQMKLDSAIDRALSGAKARNNTAVKALLDMEKIKLADDGKLSGFDEQIESLRKDSGYMFETVQQPSFTGFQPGSGKTPETVKADYESRLADARKSGSSLEAIKIKQEAAANGVILI